MHSRRQAAYEAFEASRAVGTTRREGIGVGIGTGVGIGNRLAPLALLALVAACQEPGFTTCDELVCPAGYQCRGQQCVSDEQVVACDGRQEEAECTAELDGWCRGGYCQIDLCGNGALDSYPRRGDEPCDGALGRLACADAGGDFGLTACSESCGRDTSACESFAWRRTITGSGAGRAVVAEGEGVFVARGNLVAWKRGGSWRQSAKLANPVGDLIALSDGQALVVAQRAGSALGLWHYRGADNELADTGLSLSIAGGAQWTGGVALDENRALVSAGGGLSLYRQAGGAWSEAPVALGGGCPVAVSLAVQWAASASTVYAVAGGQVVRLAVTTGPGAPSANCTVVQDLGEPVVAVGGKSGALLWAVDRRGLVYDATTWTARNTEPADAFALDSAVAQQGGGAPRLWATEGDNILVFEGGSWWRSRAGTAVLRDDLGGRFATHRPLAAWGEQVLAAQSSQEAGLVQRNDREWLLGWETQGGRGVVDVAVDDGGRVWGLLDDGRISLGAREGLLTPALSPLSPLVMAAGAPYFGSTAGVYRIALAGAGFSATREGSALPMVRGVAAPGDGALYALAQTGLYAKPVGSGGSGDWSKLLDAGPGTACPSPMRMTGALVAGAPRLFLLCRVQGTLPRGYQLLAVDPQRSPLSSTAVDLPDHVYTQLAAGSDGVAWIVSSPRVVRVAPPYAAATPLAVERLSPATGKLGALTEVMTDVVVGGDGAVYLAAARQNLFWWDGARFVRVSSSQGSTAAYVALAARGFQLYAAHQSGVDLLLRHPAP